MKDSFEFAKTVCEQDAGLFMASLDVDFLFTNVPLEETINICVDELFKSNSSIHVKHFVDYMNSKHKNINFSFETEKDEQMPFLDVKVFRENGKFVTNVYRKETFTGVYTKFSSFIPLEHKFGLVYTLLHCCFCLVSDMSLIRFTLKLKNLMKYFYLTDIPINSLRNAFPNL